LLLPVAAMATSAAASRRVVMNLLRRGGYRSIRQGLRELAYDIKGMLALGGVSVGLNAP